MRKLANLRADLSREPAAMVSRKQDQTNYMRIEMIFRNVLFTAVLVFAAQLTVAAGQSTPKRSAKPKVQSARVVIDQQGYQPASVRLRRGIPVRLTFVRTTDVTCATEVAIPDYGIRKALPLNETVVVSLIPKRSGEITFTCGMNMMRGKLIVQ